MASKNKSLAYAVWSVLPGLDADAAEAALHRHKKTIKHFLAKNVRMRQVPEVRFVSAGQHFIGSKEKQRDLDERLDEIENELLRKGVL